MPAVANIVINDGAASPVAHTYVPLGKDDKGVFWFEQVTPAPVNPLGADRIGISLKRTPNGRSQTGTAKAVIAIYEPVLEVLGNSATGITPPPTLSYELKSRQTFDLPERSTKQERKDTRVKHKNLLDNALVVAVIDDLQSLYG